MAQLYIIAFKLHYKSHTVESHLNLLPLVLSHRNIFLERVNNILLHPPPPKPAIQYMSVYSRID